MSGTYSFGGRGDSYYEYLIKEHQLLSGRNSQYARMYTTAIDSAHRYLMRSITGLTGVKNMIVVGDLHWNERVNGKITSWYSTRLDHLTCFLGGTLSLGSKLLNRPKDLVAGVEVSFFFVTFSSFFFLYYLFSSVLTATFSSFFLSFFAFFFSFLVY